MPDKPEKKHLPRTIFLQQNVDGAWFVRTGSSNGQKINTAESYSSRGAAVEQFIVEGRHQPCAHMVVIMEGHKPVTIRAGKLLPEPKHEAEAIRRARIAAAFKLKRPA